MRKLFENWDRAFKRLSDEGTISPAWMKISLGFILLSCLAVRLWTIDAPALDRTTWKEIDYIAISSNYWNHGFNLLHPEISWPADPPRYTAMEFPLVPYMAAFLYEILGYNAYSVRLITLLAFLLMSAYVYRLGKREFGPLIGISAGLASAIMPLYHPFGAFLFSEPLMIAMSVVALFHFAEWIDYGRRRDWILSWLGLTLAIALKLEPLYLLLPLLWVAFRTYRLELRRYKGFVALVLCSLLLPVLWYSYAYYLSRTSIDVFGVFGGLNGQGAHNKFQTLTKLMDIAWYKTMFNRVTVGILGGKIGCVLFVLGMIAAVRSKKGGLPSAYLIAVLCYFGLVAEGQIDAPYRQLTIIPPLALFVAVGAASILAAIAAPVERFADSRVVRQMPAWSLLLSCALLVVLIPARKIGAVLIRHPEEPSSVDAWRLAERIKQYSGPGDKLAVFGEYSIHVGGNDLSPVLYYYSQTQGWTLRRDEWQLADVSALIKKGATFFVARNISREPEAAQFLEEMKSRYRVLYEEPNQLLIDLRGNPSD